MPTSNGKGFVMWGKRFIAAVTVVLVVAVLPGRAGADLATAQEKALGMFIGTIAIKGYSGITRDEGGVLSQGEYRQYPVTLYRGRQYALFAAGDDNIDDLDIYVYDEAGNLITSDKSTDNMPWVFVAPTWTGLYYLVVHNYQGSRGWYYMAVAY